MTTAFKSKTTPLEGICGNCDFWMKRVGSVSLYGMCEMSGDLQQYAHHCTCDVSG